MTARAAAAVDHPDEVLREWLADQTFGSLHPIDVGVSRDLDSDDRESWFFDVTLPNPPVGQDTWPVDEMNSLQLATRDTALEIGLAWPWYVRFRPERPSSPS